MASCAFVVGNSGALTAGDIVVRDRIVALGHTVFVVDDAAAADASRDFVVIAESCSSVNVAAKYSTIAKGVLVLEPAVADDMDMASVGPNNTTAQTQVVILLDTHALAASLTGTVTIVSAGSTFAHSGTSELGAGVQNIYRLVGNANAIITYAYETGAAMRNSHNAEGRRVHCGIGWDAFVANLNTDGLALLDAAISWVAPSGASLARTTTDALAAADAIIRAFAGARSISDARGQSDSASRTFAGSRTTTDAVTRADVATQAKTLIRSVADALGLADAAARVGAFLRSTTDSSARADVASRTGSFIRATTDAVTRSDAAAGVRSLIRSATDAVTHSDVGTRTANLLRAVTDASARADAATRALSVIRSATDAATYADAAARAMAAIRSATDATGLSDAAVAVVTGAVTIGSAVISLVERIAAALGLTERYAASMTLSLRYEAALSVATEYDLNDTASPSATFTVDGVSTDPTTITLTVIPPDKTTATYTYAGGSVTRTSTGVYTKNITLNQRGVWYLRFAGTGACQAAAEATVRVRA